MKGICKTLHYISKSAITTLRLQDTFWGVFHAPNAITHSAHLQQTKPTKGGAQIERHIVRTHSQKEEVTLKELSLMGGQTL